MKRWSPEYWAALVILGTICGIMVTMEVGIVIRSNEGDVTESRQILVHMTDVAIGLATGLLIGKNMGKGNS